MNLETKVIGFQFEPERSICNHKGFFQDWSETCLTGKIATLAFGGSVGTAPQWKQKRNACAVKKWRRFAILIFRVYFSWAKQQFYRNYRSSHTEVFCWKGVLRNFAMNYAKFLRTSVLTEHLWWLLLELTHNLMISISICFCKKFRNELCEISKNTFSYTEHLRWLLLELTQNLMISLSICFCYQSWFQNSCHMFQTSKNSQENTCAGVSF